MPPACRLDNNKVCCYAHPESPLIEDYRAGDMICSECGLVVGDRVIDVGSEWRTFSNEKSGVDPSRVGGPENPLLSGGDLSTIIGPGTGSASFDAFGAPKYQNRRTMSSSKSICTSINNIACHGIPDDRQLANGDIINIDVTVFLNGYHGDCSKTFLVGEVDERGSFLVEATKSCLDQCISLCAPGVEFNEIGKFIQSYCDEKGLESIAAFIGHGIGSYFHGPPEIYHYCKLASTRNRTFLC